MTEFAGRLFAGRLFAGRLFRAPAEVVPPPQIEQGGRARGRHRSTVLAAPRTRRDTDDDVLIWLLAK